MALTSSTSSTKFIKVNLTVKRIWQCLQSAALGIIEVNFILLSFARLFARHIVDECYDLDKMLGSLSYYFDYDAFARDLFMCDYHFDNGHVFQR
ncbi:MAG: antirestriction protein ArdA [Bacteroidales bacterium]|nr:antirestriction protein ArdA [Bacteroidales bacterium]